MSQMREAKVRWLSAAEGGRKAPPEGSEYVTVSRFDDPAADWSGEAWSVVLRFRSGREDVDVGFLVPEAPHHLLRTGVQFALYEGARKVAEVTIG